MSTGAAPVYCRHAYALSCFTRWLISNGPRAHAYWLQCQAEAARTGMPFIDGDVEQFALNEYEREFEDSLPLSAGDDPDEDGEDEGEGQ